MSTYVKTLWHLLPFQFQERSFFLSFSSSSSSSAVRGGREVWASPLLGKLSRQPLHCGVQPTRANRRSPGAAKSLQSLLATLSGLRGRAEEGGGCPVSPSLQLPGRTSKPAPVGSARTPSCQRKRKMDSECGVFQEKWTSDYFFTEYKERAVCLVCQYSVSAFKEYNLRQHYETQHKGKYDSLVGQVRKVKILRLNHGLTTQQKTFVKQKQLNISSL